MGVGVFGASYVNMSVEEFIKQAKGKVRIIKPGEEDFTLPIKTKTKGEVITPRRKIDFGYETIDDLLEEISKRFDLEDAKPWELSQVLSMLEEGGVITSHEYWLGQGILPVNGTGEDLAVPKESNNLIKDYYANFEEYVDKYADSFSSDSRQRMQDSLLAHKKIDLIFQEIQSYRYARKK